MLQNAAVGGKSVVCGDSPVPLLLQLVANLPHVEFVGVHEVLLVLLHYVDEVGVVRTQLEPQIAESVHRAVDVVRDAIHKATSCLVLP